MKKRDMYFYRAMFDLNTFLKVKNGDIGILDATNTTKSRRETIVNFFSNFDYNKKILFLENITSDDKIISENILFKRNSPDYVNFSLEDMNGLIVSTSHIDCVSKGKETSLQGHDGKKGNQKNTNKRLNVRDIDNNDKENQNYTTCGYGKRKAFKSNRESLEESPKSLNVDAEVKPLKKRRLSTSKINPLSKGRGGDRKSTR